MAVFIPFVNVIMNPEMIQKEWYLRALYIAFPFGSTNQFPDFVAGGIIFIILKNILSGLAKEPDL